MNDYISWIRSKVGKERIILNYAGGWIENNEGKVLLQKRSALKPDWGFPGGAMNLGETAEDTAIREIKEETGFDVKIENMLGVYTCYLETHPNGDKSHSIVFFFKMNIVGGNLSMDHIETHDMNFFLPHQIPILYNELHNNILKDVLSDSKHIFH